MGRRGALFFLLPALFLAGCTIYFGSVRTPKVVGDYYAPHPEGEAPRATAMAPLPPPDAAAVPYRRRETFEVQEVPPAADAKARVCLVLCTRLADPRGFPRLPLLLESVVKFMAPTLVHTLFLVVPDADAVHFSNAVDALHRFASGLRFAVEVVPDSHLLPHPRARYLSLTPALENAPAGRGSNHRMQMLLKLGVAKLVPTEFYVTLDSDVVVRRALQFSDLVVGGRALYQREAATQDQLQDSHWKGAQAILQTPCQLDHMVGATPSVLSTSLARGLMKDVMQLYGKKPRKPLEAPEVPPKQDDSPVTWDLLMFEQLQGGHDWSEYSLYWTYACKTGLVDRYHTLPPPNIRLYKRHEADWEAIKQWKPSDVFRPDADTLFAVVESASAADSAQVARDLAPFLARDAPSPPALGQAPAQ
eukprot:EG_transcript_11632